MHREIYKDNSFRQGHAFSLFWRKVCLPGVFCLALVWMQVLAVGMPVAYASGPGGDISNPSVLAVDIAKPAIVRIVTQMTGQLTVKFSNGQNVTFPLTPQNGVNGYDVGVSGSGAFISGNGDILTADHVINPVVDDRQSVDQELDQEAAPDVASYINQNLHPAQQATADGVTQELTSGQLQSSSQYQKPSSRVLLSTDFSGPLNGVSLNALPPSQIANVDKIEAESLTSQADTAIIHANGMTNMPMLQVGDSTTVHQLDQLTILGFPGVADVGTTANDFLTSTIITASVSALKAAPSGAPLIQIESDIQPGNSGGPALNSSGQVVGVVSSKIVDTTTGYLEASSSAEQLMQKAHVNTTPSALQQAWSKAMDDYASTVPGHWHQSMREFQQISAQYSQFKAVNPFLQYATQQAQSEKQTQEAPGNGTPTTGTNHTSATTSTGNFNSLLVYGGIGIAVLLVIVLILAFSRRRKPAAVGAPGVPVAGMGQMPGTGLPQTPSYPGQAAYPPAQQYGRPAGQPGQPVTPAPFAPQPGYRPAPPQAPGVNMGAFGAPVPSTPRPGTAGPDVTLVAQARKPVPQWRTWPCGHINREDARFCGTCGESAPPPPQVRRVEQ